MARSTFRWPVHARFALLGGVAAGIAATAAQVVLWWGTSVPVPETLLRDARLTAAIVMGSSVLPPPSTWRWDIMLVATLIHFTLSVAYAVIPAFFVWRLRTVSAVFAGALYGLAIYGVNLYGFTALFPWFTITRNWITALTHVVFGIALTGGCKLLFACQNDQRLIGPN